MQENASLKEKNKYLLAYAHMCFILLSCTITVELFKLYQSYNWYVFGLWLSIRIILAKSNKVRRVSTWEIQYMIEGLNLTIEGPFLTCFMVLGMIKNYLLEQFLYSATTLWNIHVWISILLFTILLQCYCSNMHKTNFNTFHCLLFEANWCSRARTYTYSSHSITVILNQEFHSKILLI